MKKIYLLLSLMTLSAPAIQAQCTSTFGNFPPPFTTPANFSPNYLLGDKYTLSTGGTLLGLGFAGNGTNGSIQMAIYTDVSGNPGTLVAATYTGVVGTGNITLAIPTPTTIPAGDYWIMAVYTGGSNSGHVNFNGSSSQTVKYISLTFGTMPPNTAGWSTYTGQDFNYWGVLSGPATITGATSPICAGQSLTLTTAPATSYTWSTGANTSSIVVTPTASAVYSVSVVSGTLSCSNSASITVNPSPTVSISGPTVACAGDVVTYTASGASTYTWNTSATTTTLAANTSSTTSYTVTGTSAGCSNVAVASLSVVPVPTVGLASTFTTCAGNPVSITATGATTYSWSTSASGSSIAPSPTASANYSVTGYNGTCSNTAVAMVTVTPLPTLSVSSTSSLICTGQTASLTANGATTYSWSTSGTTSVIAVSPTVTTAYTVTGTSAGCSNVSTITQSVSACTGVLSESNLKETVSVFPNPAKNAITIKLDGDASVNIFNSLGSLILKDELHEGNNTVDLQHQPNGIYFVIINRAGSSETIKIIKEN